mgnify:CR=1 FL=1
MRLMKLSLAIVKGFKVPTYVQNDELSRKPHLLISWIAIGRGVFMYSFSARQVSFQIKFKLINLKKVCRAKHEYIT